MSRQQQGVVNIRGKEYHTVAKRVNDFREYNEDKYGITTEILTNDDLVTIRATITAREDGFVVATGTAEERRNSTQINKTSALENAETSAIGRALANFGIGGTEFASANEVQNAIHQQEGQGQGKADAEVSPPAGGKRKPKHSALQTKVRGLFHDLNGCGDANMLEAFMVSAETVETIKQLKEKLPHLWDGEDWPEGLRRPEEFEPLSDMVERLRKSFDKQEF